VKYLLDTNVFREVGKTDPHENVQAWLGHVDDADLAISTLTIREVTKGIERLRAKKPDIAAAIEARVDEAYQAFGDRVLPVSQEVAKLWGEMLARSEKHVDDTGLAATARVHDLVLVTRNLDHVKGRGAATLDPFKAKPKINRP
jgi:predicted nucleic acid-binding protein